MVMAMAVAVGEAMVMAVAAMVVAAGYKWEPVDRQPTTIVFQNGLIAAPDDPIGLSSKYSRKVTAGSTQKQL